MPATLRTAGSTFAASLGLHGLLLLLAAAVGAVLPTREPDKSPPPPPEEALADEPDMENVEVTFVPQTEPPAVALKKPDPSKPEPSAPAPDQPLITIIAGKGRADLTPMRDDTPFVSSQNLRAAATAAPKPGGDPLLPSQDGVDRKELSLNQGNYSEGNPGRPGPPQPESPPVASTPPEPVRPPEPVPPDNSSAPPPPAGDRPPDAENVVRTTDPLAPAPADKKPPEIAMRERLPEPLPPSPKPKPAVKPKPRPPVDPVAAAGGGAPGAKPAVSSVKTKIEGAIAVRGDRSSVDAKDTPEGRYNNDVYERVGLLWNRKLATVRGIAGLGTVEVEFDIDPNGRISNVRLVDPGKANPVLEDVSLSAVINAKLPPPPESMQREMRDPLVGGKLRRKFTFTRL